jgi:DNA-binding NtrC family response regulator
MARIVLMLQDRQVGWSPRIAALEEAGYELVYAKQEEELRRTLLGSDPDALVLELNSSCCDANSLLRGIRRKTDLPILILAARASVQEAVAALSAGADDFTSPVDMEAAAFVHRIRSLIARRREGRPCEDLEKRIAGSSPVMQRCRSRIRGLAPLRAPVLVVGEEGSGRSAVVAALHDYGSSAGERLEVLDSSEWRPAQGLPREGAVYLKEVHRFGPAARAFFLERLREAERRNFAKAPRFFASGIFLGPSFASSGEGPELHGALGRLAIELTPLRERPDDVPEIADALLARIGVAMGRRAGLSEASKAFLAERSWPGNALQLERFLERALAFNDGCVLRRDQLAELCDERPEALGRLRAFQLSREKDELHCALREAGGNISRAAERLSRSRASVYRLIQKYGVPAPS